MQDLMEIFKDILLYIPRRIYAHFRHIKELEEENIELQKSVTNRDIILKRIVCETECNSYGNNQIKLRKIKELAQTFPNDLN